MRNDPQGLNKHFLDRGEDSTKGYLWSASPRAQMCLQLTRALFLHVLVQGSPLSYPAPGSQVKGLGRGRWRRWLSCVTHTTVPRLILPLWCHLGFGYLDASFPAPQGLELSPPAQTAGSWKIRDTSLFGGHFPMEPRAAAVLPATSREMGSTSARPSSHTAQGEMGTTTATCFLPANTRKLDTPAQATV